MTRHCTLALARLFVPLTLLTLSTGASALAQGQSTASIIGRVTDESGSVLPGVSVSATSTALQVPEVSVVTDDKGEYRLVELPAGAYTVTYALQGFQTVRREGVRLTAGFVAKIDVSVKVGGVSESITVTGQSPVVDVTSTNTKTAFVQEALEAIPSSRNSISSLLALTPGVRNAVDVGGSRTGLQPTIRAFGRVGQSQLMIEGIETREQTGGATGTYFDYMTLTEVNFQTMAGGAETATSGIMVSALVKSGGNDFHGSIWTSKVNPSWQSNNVDEELIARGVAPSGNSLVTRWDVSGDLGGRILKDKLWFYGALRKQRAINLVLGLTKPDGSPGDQPLDMDFATLKLSYQPTVRHKFIFFRGYQKKSLDGGGSVFVPWESRYTQRQPGAPTKVEWTGLFGDSMVATVQAGQWWYNSRKGSFTDDIATFDVSTQKYTGQQIATYLAPGTAHNWRPHFKGSVSWLRKDLLWGDHDLKFGGEHYRERRSEQSWARPNGDYSLQFLSGAPYRFVAYNSPVEPENSVDYSAAFFQDRWSVNRRLTMDLGLRFDRYDTYIPEQTREAGQFVAAQTFAPIEFSTWNSLSPRLHAAYDLSGNGRTVIKGGWGRFGELRTAYEVVPYNPNASQQTIYTWHDTNGNRQFDTGEVNLDPNGGDFVERAAFRGAASATVTRFVNPDETQPKLDEFSVSVEREVMADWAVRGSFVFSRGFNNRRLLNPARPYSAYSIPVTNRDPGPDGVVGNADDPGTTFTYYDYPAELRGVAFQQATPVNDPDYVDHWRTFEVSATKRMSQNWQLQGSLSATKKDMRFLQDQSARSLPELTPNSEIFPEDKTWEVLGKLAGSYRFPYSIMLAGNFTSTLGDPYARQVLFTGGRQITSIVLNVEELNAHYLPTVNLLDLRLEKEFHVGFGRITGWVDISNVLNTNAVLGVNRRSGPTFEQPTSIVPPRIFMLGAAYKF